VTLADFILMARQSVGDGPTDNLSRLESLNNPDEAGTGVAIIDGVNKTFVTENFPVVSVDLMMVDGSTISSGYTIDTTTGTIVFGTAPQTSAYISYYYYLLTDQAWTDFVIDALARMDKSTGNPANDVPQLEAGLISPLSSYACGLWARRIAGQSGLWYNQRLQERQEDRDSISKKYLAMSEAMLKDGDIARDDLYKGAGMQYRPAFVIVMHPPRPFTPMR
jgi:hypothetical protein